MLHRPLKALLLGALLLVSAGGAAFAQALSSPEHLAEVRARIAEDRAAFAAAYARSDVDAVMSFYDKDATFAGTLQPFWLEGAAAIRDLWTRYFAAYPKHTLIFRQPELRAYGPTAVETGYLEMYMQPPSGPTIATYIRYSITRTETKSGWKIVNMNVAKLPSQ